MKRFSLLGLVFALASCGSSLEANDQALACYDTGRGMKCVPLSELPPNTKAECVDNDGEIETSQSSESGISASDNDASESSDAPGVLPTGGGHDHDDGDCNSDEDDSGHSDSGEPDQCAPDGPMTDGHGGDHDGDGTSDSEDCDCMDPDSPPTGGGDPTIP